MEVLVSGNQRCNEEREREKRNNGVAKLQHVVTEAWTTSPSYVKVHLGSLFAARVEICYESSMPETIHSLSAIEKDSYVHYVSFSRWMRVWRGVGVTQRGRYVTHHLRRQIIGKKFALRFLEFENVWKRERWRVVRGENRIFSMTWGFNLNRLRVHVTAQSWISKEKKKKMKRNSNNEKKKHFCINICSVRLWNVALSALFLSWFARFSRRGESNCSESRRPWAVSMEKGRRMLIER